MITSQGAPHAVTRILYRPSPPLIVHPITHVDRVYNELPHIEPRLPRLKDVAYHVHEPTAPAVGRSQVGELPRTDAGSPR